MSKDDKELVHTLPENPEKGKKYAIIRRNKKMDNEKRKITFRAKKECDEFGKYEIESNEAVEE